MRWPLRNQILLPVAALLLVTLLGVSITSVALAVRRTEGRIESQLRDVARTLSESSFPLTNNVLRQMRGLSGAEFLLADEAGRIVAASRSPLALVELPSGREAANWEQLTLTQAVPIGEERYFHIALRLQRGGFSPQPMLLHILYPERQYREALWEAVFPPAAIGGVALVLAVLLGTGIASRVSRPIGQLRSHVEQIAEGDFRPMPLPARNDEILDLATAINHMAEMLARYETEIRRSEQLRTLGQLGGGLAHQMRNAVTGCRMALELHHRECPMTADCESLTVAVRQLTLIEQHLRRFLSLGNTRSRPHQEVSLATVIENVLPLVRPAAAHVGVKLQTRFPDQSIQVQADNEALEQLLVNLLLNAIEAASSGEQATAAQKRVVIELRRDAERAVLEVSDSGPGPADHVNQSLFDPLVTEKPDGIGLGLSVARAIVEQHDGEIRWQRRDGMTCFWIEIPFIRQENDVAQAVSR